MRTAFLSTVTELAKRDPRVFLITGDLGFSVLEPFARDFPNRFLNAGVAEQNMTGVAAGLALSGKVVFTYSIANFPILRCLEQVRNDVCYHKLNVKIVSVGGGLAYGSAGYSHHGVEELGVARMLPNMTVFAPGDSLEAAALTEAALETPGPVYLRLGKGNERRIHQQKPSITVGEPLKIRDGRDVVLLSTGAMLSVAVDAAEALASRGIYAAVFSVPTLKPLTWNSLVPVILESRAVVSVEEHMIGGLYSATAEMLCTLDQQVYLSGIYLREPMTMAGSQDYLRKQAGLSVADVVAAAEQLLSRKREFAAQVVAPE